MMTEWRKREVNMRMHLERNLDNETRQNLRDWVRSMYDCPANDDKAIWDVLSDLDLISPINGYDVLVNALRDCYARSLAKSIEELGKEVINAMEKENNCRSTSFDAINGKRCITKSASFEHDSHKELLNFISMRLDNSKWKAFKAQLRFRFNDQIPARIKDEDMAALDILELMEKRQIIRRGWYQNLRILLEDIQMKKFHPRIFAVEKEINRSVVLRSDSMQSEVMNYPILQSNCFVVRHGDFSKTCYEYLENELKFQHLACNDSGVVLVPDDAEFVVICSSFDVDDRSQTLDCAFPLLERQYSSDGLVFRLPVLYLVDVHCSQLPPFCRLPCLRKLPPNSFVIFLFTSDRQRATDLWNDFLLTASAMGRQEPLERLVKLWQNELMENVVTETPDFDVMTISRLMFNLYLSTERRAVVS